MLSGIVEFWVTALYQVWIWFTWLLDASGMTGLYLMMFALVASYRLLIVPIMGRSSVAGSDTAQRRKKEEQ